MMASQEGSETHEDETGSDGKASGDGESSDGRSSDGEGSSSGGEIADAAAPEKTMIGKLKNPAVRLKGQTLRAVPAPHKTDDEIPTRAATPAKETKRGTPTKETMGGNPNSSQMLSLPDLDSKDT